MTMRTFHTGGAASEKGDITGGLSNVETIFEASHPKKPQIAKWDGTVKLSEIIERKICLDIINPFTKFRDQHLISGDESILVAPGDEVVKGQFLTGISFDAHKVFKEIGSQKFHRGQEVDRSDFLEQNEWVNGKGGQPAEAKPILLGITQVAQRTKSFLSAASFQYTRKILTEAAVMSKRDDLLGLKEKIMTGGLIPVGSGFNHP